MNLLAAHQELRTYFLLLAESCLFSTYMILTDGSMLELGM
jgi:hypothetical protein